MAQQLIETPEPETAGMTGAREMTGAEMVVQTLIDQGVKHIFGYPGGAALPIYDEIFQQEQVQHILVRHEQAAGHAAEGYARSTGEVGVVLVTSGPGATNMVTPLTDALMDSIPLVCISAQVPTHLIGSDAFQECDTVGITRPCTKHNWLIKRIEDLPRILHEAFRIAKSGRPGPVVVDIPKDIQFKTGIYENLKEARQTSYQPRLSGDERAIRHAVQMMRSAKRPILYTGGGVINSGPRASELLRELADLTGFPLTSTLMGLGAYPASGKQWLGMLGMHGTYEANLAMHGSDVMVAIGSRFDDRITGRTDAFAPNSKKIHIDIDASSFNKNIRIDVPIQGDVANILEAMIRIWKEAGAYDQSGLKPWWKDIDTWRAKHSLAYHKIPGTIMPQTAIERLYALTKDRETFITTEVGQHQMWAAQYFGFEQPNHWMTSGGLGTMGYGFPSAVGVQVAHRDALVVCVAGDASIQMNIQELSTAIQHELPVKVMILNNQYMGMVRQWQQLLHGNRLAHSYTEAMPDFVKLAEAYGAEGIRAERPDELDDAIRAMINSKKPVLFDCVVAQNANCLPMIPSGKAHNEILLATDVTDDDIGDVIDAKGKQLV